jgi:hypothetical protein
MARADRERDRRRGWRRLALAAPLLFACGAAQESADAVSDAPLLVGVRFVEMGRPAKPLPVIADLAVFRERLYLATSVNPLGAFGTRVLSTADGASYRVDLERPFSQGLLRLRVARDALFVPDADPQGLAPGRLYRSDDGERFEEIALEGAVHTYDVIEHRGALFTSNGMDDGRGALLREPPAPGAAWQPVARFDVNRIKFMVEHRGDLLISKGRHGSPADYVRITGEPGAAAARLVDAIPGEASTYRWYVSERGRLFWSLYADQRFQLLWSDGGDRWRPAVGLPEELVAGLAELDGNLYALTPSGLFGSRDGLRFEPVAPAPDAEAFAPVWVASETVNADACASLVRFAGHLWAGATRGGRLFRVE